ncbi:centrosomal protein of 85 kDa-like isoform X2 [Corticium candelabrum]|uniref:centrosomal protein of 85 kDa-like isoform X2 n=1 Tax=Corticium candelabrum TaxID=121492 RepID=UPI002E274A75|nr:centrosomal protein of 85 kDa-like isoform X2 [Corticium candelabrum]
MKLRAKMDATGFHSVERRFKALNSFTAPASRSRLHSPTSSDRTTDGFANQGVLADTPQVAIVSPGMRKLEERMNLVQPVDDVPVTPDSVGSPLGSLSLKEKAKWEPLLRSKDELLQQKDLIIARQRKVIERLQLESQEMESQLNRAYMAASQDDMLTIQLQEHQCELASLKASLSDVHLGRKRDVRELHRKLGEAEHEYEKLKQVLETTSQSMSTDIAALRSSLKEKEEAFESMATSNQQMSISLKEAEDMHSRYQSYVSQLPTAEEHERIKQEVVRLGSQCENLQQIIIRQEADLKHSECQQAARETEQQKLQKQVDALLAHRRSRSSNEMLGNVHDLEEIAECSTIEAERDHLLKALQDTKTKSKLHIEDMKQRFKERYTEATNMLKSQLQKIFQQCKSLEQRLQQEEDTVTALRTSLATAEEELVKTKATLRTLTDNNQELLDKTLTLQDQLTLRTSHADDCARDLQSAAMKLQSLMKSSIQDLRDLVNCGMEVADGRDPNLNMLLGTDMRSLPSESHLLEESDPITGVQMLIGTVDHLQRDIESLRTYIRDAYAERMGRTAVCAVQ